MQRFWLTATQAGLLVQPEMTPLIFSRDHREGRRFTEVRGAEAAVHGLNERLAGLLAGHGVDRLFFMGRMGKGPAPKARSTRKPLKDLMVNTPISGG
jgi:hypothetical protein